MKHELVIARRQDWFDGDAPLYSENGRPALENGFMIGLLLLKHIFGLSDEGCASVGSTTRISSSSREEFFQHAFPHERSELSHWRKRLGDKLELLLAESQRLRMRPACAAWTSSGARSTPGAAEGHRLSDRCQAVARGHIKGLKRVARRQGVRLRHPILAWPSAPG